MAQTIPSGPENSDGFCSLRSGSWDTRTGSSHRSAPFFRRAQITFTSALPSKEPANQTHSISPFSSSKSPGPWAVL